MRAVTVGLRVVVRAALAVLGGMLLFGGLTVGHKVVGVRSGTVGQDLPVTDMDLTNSVANNSPSILGDPADARFVVMANRLDAPDFSCALQLSGDHGRTWQPDDPVPSLPAGAEKCYAPEAAFDRDGALYYLFVGLQGGGNQPMGAFITISRDHGNSWSRPLQVLGPLNFSVRMAIDPTLGARGRIDLVWIHTDGTPTGGFSPAPNPILSAYSDDGGRHFSPPVQVSDPNRSRVVGPVLTLGPRHVVHVAYYDLGADAVDYQGLEGDTWNGTWSIVMSTSTDGGQHFGASRVVDDQIVPNERVILIFTMPPPALVADSTGRLCAAWTDARFGDADAVLRCSGNDGAGWTPLVRLNDDPVGNGKTQYQPRLSVAPDGRIDAIFYDRRNDPKNVNNDVYYTYSTDHGRTWAANRKLTGSPSSTTVGQQYTNPSAQGLVEFGSRTGLYSTNEGAVAAWTDTRNNVAFSTGTAQDIFSNVVTFTSTVAEQPIWARLLGGLLLAAGVGAIAQAVLSGRRHSAPPESPEVAPSEPEAAPASA
jgi:hypothetical protein